jgi:hypothetical protein
MAVGLVSGNLGKGGLIKRAEFGADIAAAIRDSELVFLRSSSRAGNIECQAHAVSGF